MFGSGRCEDPVHRYGKSVGERLRQELQREFKDELLHREIFYSLQEAHILVEQWRREYNTIRRHSALGYRPPYRHSGPIEHGSDDPCCSDRALLPD